MARKKKEEVTEETKPATKKATKTSKAAKSTKSKAKETTAKSSTAKKPSTAKKSAAKKSEADKPAAKKTKAASAEKNSGAKKPATKKAAAKKTTAKAGTAPKKAKATASNSKAAESKKAKPQAPKKTAAKQAAAAAPSPAETAVNDLPGEYGETKIVLLVRDPDWAFAYWEIDSKTREKYGLKRAQAGRSIALRVHDITDRKNPSFFDVPVNSYTSSWYLRLPSAERVYQVELGVYGDQGEFMSLALSNEITSPRMGIAQETDAVFAKVTDEIYDQIVSLSGGENVASRISSEHVAGSLQERVFETLMVGGPSSGDFLSSWNLYSGGLASESLSSWNLSSGALFSGALFSGALVGEERYEEIPARPAGKEREFWLEVGVDVIVYGATEPGANVRFMGREIALTPEGTFRFRMVLPDSEVEFPVEATSPDGEEERRVMPVVTRRTHGDPRKPIK